MYNKAIYEVHKELYAQMTRNQNNCDFTEDLAKLDKAIKPIKKFPVDIYITAYLKYKIRRDSSNISDKELIDGLVMAGIIPDDSTEYVRWSATKAIIGAKENKVIIDIISS